MECYNFYSEKGQKDKFAFKFESNNAQNFLSPLPGKHIYLKVMIIFAHELNKAYLILSLDRRAFCTNKMTR